MKPIIRISAFIFFTLSIISCLNNNGFRKGMEFPVNYSSIQDTMIFDETHNAVVKLGMHRDDVIKIYGNDLKYDTDTYAENPEHIYLKYYDDKIVFILVYFGKDTTGAEKIRTFRGISVTDSYEDVKNAYATDLRGPYGLDHGVLLYFNTKTNQIIRNPFGETPDPEAGSFLYAMHFDIPGKRTVRHIIIKEEKL